MSEFVWETKLCCVRLKILVVATRITEMEKIPFQHERRHRYSKSYLHKGKTKDTVTHRMASEKAFH